MASAESSKEWLSKIHPVYAMIFSFLSLPHTLCEAQKEVSSFLGITPKEAGDVLRLFLDSKEPFKTQYKGFVSTFPPKLLITTGEEKAVRRVYTPGQFAYTDIDIKRERCFVSPVGLVYIVNNTCATNCIYCYADKRNKSSVLSLEEVEKICAEAKSLNIGSIFVSGGEVFMYSKWYELLKLLSKYGYKPNLISTKVPINEKDILKFKEFGIKLQVSLDAFDAATLTDMLGVNSNYFSKIKETILLLEKHRIEFQVATIITNKNSSIHNLEALKSFLEPLTYLKRWEIRVAFKSLYSKQDFETIKASNEQVNEISDWVTEIRPKTSLNILWVPGVNKKYFSDKGGSRFFNGSRCSANFSHLVILPDGKVTICEQLYWNPRFIIGDVKEQTIKEIWNSSKALQLADIPQGSVRKASACATCSLYDQCKSFPNKCYADVLKAYGDENWDYPDPRCEKAPYFAHHI